MKAQTDIEAEMRAGDALAIAERPCEKRPSIRA
jgi:hypothetical protein